MNTASLTYGEAAAKIRNSRSGQPKIGNNTVLHAGNLDGGASIHIRYHFTDVVSLHSDGTYSLRTDGWDTVTTMRRLNDYSPARVYSDRGTLYVWHSSDPKTPAKITKCRTCHGTGLTHTHAWTERYGILPRDTFGITDSYVWNNTTHDGKVYPRQYPSRETFTGAPLMRDGQYLADQPRGIHIVGQVVRHKAGTWGELPDPVFHPSEALTCGNCSGTGRADYGSKPNPVIFYDGITVDADGMVTDPNARRRYESDEAKAARKAAEAKAARKAALAERKAQRAARTAFLAEYGLTVTRGWVTVFKAVDDELRSAYISYRVGPDDDGRMVYPIGETMTAPDWDGLVRCGGGLHFGPSPDVARSYFREATRFLACEVPVRDMVVIDDKIKAKSCRVLHEVDMDGERV